MRTSVRRRTAAGAAMLWAAVIGGCAAPPSVTPLLEVAGAALRQESQQIDAQAQRDRAYFDQARQSLAQAFDADLREQATLTPQWVTEAVAGYVPAREELAKREAELAQQRAQRKDNLAAAGDALGRAIELLRQQDQLVIRGVGLDLWRELRGIDGTASASDK